MKARGVRNPINLPAEIDDVRPWRWAGFLIDVGYSYFLDFPLNEGLMDGELKRTCAKAMASGMKVERVRDVNLVIACVADTAARKRFAPQVSARDLSVALGLLGPEQLRLYACFDQDGRLASSCAVLHARGTRAVGWLLGTKTGSLAPGAGHLLWRQVFDDLSSAGATGIDFGATDNPTVATFKSRWGSRLMPTYNIRTYSSRALAGFVRTWIRSRTTDHGTLDPMVTSHLEPSTRRDLGRHERDPLARDSQ